MADNGVENNSGSQNVDKQIEQKVAAQSAEQLKQEMNRLEDRVKEAKKDIIVDMQENRNFQHKFDGDKDDIGTARGRANSITEFIKKMFVAAKIAPEKVPAAEKPVQTDPKAPVLTPESTKLLKKLGEKIIIENITDQTAPYFYDLLKSITNGEVKTTEDLLRAVQKAVPLREISPGMFEKLQNASVDYAVNNFNTPEKEAKQKFGVPDVEQNQGYNEQNERRAVEDRSADQSFDENWQHYFSGYFSEGDEKNLVHALYTPTSFVKYYEGVQQWVKDNNKNKNINLDEKEVSKKASEEMEARITLLFGKLYTRLDHEKPAEYFQSIEQEDIMKGIIPVKHELKRRLQKLGSKVDEYLKEQKDQGKEVPIFFQRFEQDTETVAIDVGEKGKQNLKPRVRYNTKMGSKTASGSHFTHYLDQVIDHYIEARKYTHNSRAVFLHPADPQKGFYGQMALFAAETSTLDFDQMMLLPDNDVFQSAFGLYNKMIEEGFAKHDWRHPSASMFTPKMNQHTTQIEERVIKQLKAMYEDMSEERLSAALTMAVGASRGMFLTEPEMAAHADPHLSEKGGSTFTSYYNQSATALMAFNPQHLIYRFHGSPSMLDPIFFMPIDKIESSQAFNNHKELWEKAKIYKASFLKGREDFKGQTTFFDMLDNIGLIGGPMQRKGWRTQWQFDSLYVSDRTETIDKEGRVIKGAVKTNHMKTFKHLENIGYELLQDYVTKLTVGNKPDDDDDLGDGNFLSARNTFGANAETKKLANQRKELFEYVFKKYFDKEPKDLGNYLDSIRKGKRDELIKSIRLGNKAPKNIDQDVEGAASREFLDRMLARVVIKRLPSKILRMDRDRMSKKGTSRYKQVMKDMGLEGNFDTFDDIMQDMILAEQMMRKNVSAKMRDMQAKNRPREEYGDIPYEINEDSIKALFGPLIAKGDGTMTQERLDRVLKLYGHIQNNYVNNEKFSIEKELVPYFKSGAAGERKSKYTIALDETDLSFIPFRAGGPDVLKRSISDIASVEENVVKPIGEFVKKMRAMAIDGKKDFGPLLEIFTKVWNGLDGIIGFPYANELVSKMAAMTITYMKKDTQARAFMGIGGVGRFNSMAAESAGKKVGVWEWDSADIDRFITALEARGLVPGTPYNIGAEPTREPVYVNVPFKKEPVKLPDKISTSNIAKLFGGTIEDSKNTMGILDGKVGKITIFGKTISIPDIPLFSRRKHDFHDWTSKKLREKYGGTGFDRFFDIVNMYLPLVAIFILWNLIKKAFEDSEGKKK